MNLNFADVVVILLILFLLFLCFRSLFTKKKYGKRFYSCNHDCANCALAEEHGMIKRDK